jgi:hypothetical protein
MAAILKTDQYSKLERLEHWKVETKPAMRQHKLDLSTTKKPRKKQENPQIIRDLRHLTFQVSVKIVVCYLLLCSLLKTLLSGHPF